MAHLFGYLTGNHEFETNSPVNEDLLSVKSLSAIDQNAIALPSLFFLVFEVNYYTVKVALKVPFTGGFSRQRVS